MKKVSSYLPLFETKAAKGRLAYWLYAASVLVGICFIFLYRAIHIPFEGKLKLWAWIGLFMAELWFSFYWLCNQFVRCSPIYRYTFKDRLSERFGKVLPGVDIFVCTADPVLEPPTMVINTVLSVMAYDYPPEKLNVYLSDDGGSDLMFYALLEASRFSRYWLPFCKKFQIEPRSPAAYFSSSNEQMDDLDMAKEFVVIKRLYEEMTNRIDEAAKLGEVSDEARKQHKGFREWDFVSSKHDHQAIVQILIDGRDTQALDTDGQRLPTLVYLAREKRPQYHHNFKAGAMNSLIRVSSRISNSSFILNVDCDMYSNNADSIKDALCFFMDEERSHCIGYVQYPQCFTNITKNDLYSNSLGLYAEVEMPGIDANGGPMYIGSGCFHRRDVLCGKKYEEQEVQWRKKSDREVTENVELLEEACKIVASCSYEENTQWGKEMGVKYGCPVEDIITGLSIQCRGWRSVGYNPERKAFLGLAPTTLLQTLVQWKRWSEGHFQIFLSKNCPFIYGHGKIPLKLQFSYCCYSLWSPNCLAALWYVTVPSSCLAKGISLFPKISSPWVLPFVYVVVAMNAYSIGEFLYCGGTFKGWLNDQRIWLYKRVTSFLFAFCDTILKLTGFASSGFVITAKVSDEDVSKRYEQEMMEFGVDSPMFTILATLALFNLLCLGGATKRLIMDSRAAILGNLMLQMVLCGSLVLINLPVYQGLFFRNNKGRMPLTVTYRALVLSTFGYCLTLY